MTTSAAPPRREVSRPASKRAEAAAAVAFGVSLGSDVADDDLTIPCRRRSSSPRTAASSARVSACALLENTARTTVRPCESAMHAWACSASAFRSLWAMGIPKPAAMIRDSRLLLLFVGVEASADMRGPSFARRRVRWHAASATRRGASCEAGTGCKMQHVQEI
eukprot:scaffold109774_cov54-Phaeocystis_antarctica.AAC.2